MRYCLAATSEVVARVCEDGVLVYDSAMCRTHLLHPAAWRLFLSLPQDRSPVEVDGTGHVVHDYRSDDPSPETLIAALESAGLVGRC